MRHLARCHSRSALSIVDTLSAIKCKNIEKSHNKVQQGAGKCNKVVLQCTSVYFIVLHYTSLYFTVLHCTSLYFIVFHCTSLYFVVLYCTSLYFVVLSCAFLCIGVFIVLTYILWRTGSHCQTLSPFESILSQSHERSGVRFKKWLHICEISVIGIRIE